MIIHIRRWRQNILHWTNISIVDVSDLFVNVADLNFLDDEEIDQEAYSVLDIVIAPDDDGNPGQDDLAVIHVYILPLNEIVIAHPS